MPLARIDMPAGKSAEHKRQISDVLYEAIIGILKAPEGDRFHVDCYLARRSRDGASREGLLAVIRAAQGRQIQTLLTNDASGLPTMRLWTGARANADCLLPQ